MIGVSRSFLLPTVLSALVALTLAPQPAAASPAHAERPPRGQIALTFDDLPGLSLANDQRYIDALNRDLLAALRRNHLPATGFINAGKVDSLIPAHQLANLRNWRAAGVPLGNHTYSHATPNKLGVERYLADIARGEPLVRRLMHAHNGTTLWFRHPYLETGSPAAVRAQIDAWLAAHHYRVAPVTLDADDWEFAEPYDDALVRHDTAAADRIRTSYLAHTAATIDWARKSARTLFARDIPYVLLLHDTRLNADSLDALTRLFKAQRLHPVTLAKAMRDPAYRTADHWTKPDGVEWLERWSETLGKTLPWDDYPDVPQDIQDAYNKVEPGGG